MAEEGMRRINRGTLFRLFLGLCIVFTVGFLLVRFITVRESRSAQEPINSTQTQNMDDGKIATDSKDSESQAENSSSVLPDTSIPTGIADSEQPLPDVGMSVSPLLVSLLIMISVYLGGFVLQRRLHQTN